MMTTSAFTSSTSFGKAGNGSAVSAQSEAAGAIGVQTSAMSAALPVSASDRGVGERLHGGEMEIRLCELRHLGRSAKTFHALAPLDPADLVAKLSRDTDVMVLALRHVQNFGLLVAERRLPALVVGEEFRIGLCNPGVVGADGVVEGIVDGVRVARERDAIGMGHGDQADPGAQALQCRNRIRKRLPAQHGELE